MAMYRKLLAVAVCAVSSTAFADGSQPPDSANTPQKAVTAAEGTMPACPQDTGTHIRQKPGNCLSTPGRTYGSNDVRLTGGSDAAEALRLTDPSLTVSH